MKSYRSHFSLRLKFLEMKNALEAAGTEASNAERAYSDILEVMKGWSRTVTEVRDLKKAAEKTDKKYKALEQRFFTFLESNGLHSDTYETAHEIPGDVTATSWYKKASRVQDAPIGQLAEQTLRNIVGLVFLPHLDDEVYTLAAMRPAHDVASKLIETIAAKPKASHEDKLKIKMCLVLIIRNYIEAAMFTAGDWEDVEDDDEEYLEELHVQISYSIDVLASKETDGKIAEYLSSKL